MTEYNTELTNQPQAIQSEDQQVSKQQIAPDLAASSFSRDIAPESPKLTSEEQTAAYNESIMERNNTERAEKLGHGQQQGEQTDEKKNVYAELAQQVAEQQKQESPGLQQERQAELGD